MRLEEYTEGELLMRIEDLDLELNKMKKQLKIVSALGYVGLNLAIERLQRDKDLFEKQRMINERNEVKK